jgi:molybdopterin converting factor small subunit
LITGEGGDNIKVHVKFFGLIAAGLGYKEKEYDITEGSTINKLLGEIKLPVDAAWVVVSVNGKVKDKSSILKDGDELLVLPVGGGG